MNASGSDGTNRLTGDATLDAAPRDDAPPATPSPRATPDSASLDRAAPVELVEGTAPELTRETQSLLRGRLRIASVLLAVGFAGFLVNHFFFADLAEPAAALLFGFHAATTLVLALAAVAVCRHCELSIRTLRGLELAIFGLPAALFLLLQWVVTVESCRRGHFDFPVGVWLVLIFIYALFIPNTRRRAIVVIGLLTAAPLTMLVVQLAAYPEVAGCASGNQVAGIALMFLLTGVGGVFGVDTIGSLRREAFEARQLGRYRLTRRIGAGGMGEVYLAEHTLMKRPCVVKLIRPEKAGDSRVLARFQREVRATARLSHWNTVEIFDYGSTEDGTFYYVMEYLPGMSLAGLVERFGPMPPARAIHFLRQACDALAEAHAVGLIHRDIKPGNIFAAVRGGVFDVAKVLDFGLVKPIVDDEQSMQLTVEGAITGSPLFMSPEQALGEANPDARSDVYALGAVGYYLLTGRPPFVADKAMKVLVAHAREPVVPPSAHRPDVPDDLEQVILRCLEKAPAERYQSAEELGEALAACRDAGRWTRQDAAEWWGHSQASLHSQP
jgi:eukaryotic-like serine/threonine-protein kinase